MSSSCDMFVEAVDNLADGEKENSTLDLDPSVDGERLISLVCVV